MRNQLISLALGFGVSTYAQVSTAGDGVLQLKPSFGLSLNHVKSRLLKPISPAELSLRFTSGLMLSARPAEPLPSQPERGPEDLPRVALLNEARMWESRKRDDLSLLAINKLLRSTPDDPDVLGELAMIQIHANQLQDAQQTLAKLRRINPSHPDVARIETLLRLNGSDQEKLRRARMLAEAGQSEQSLSLLRELYPSGPPNGDLALEYWEVVANTNGGWDNAYTGLKQLVHDYPDDPGYRLALADHIAIRKPDDPVALKTIEDISKLPQYEKQARSVWRRAMLRLGPTESSIPLIQRYLVGETVEDQAIKEHLAAIRQAVEQHRKLLADPYYRAKVDGLALLDGGKIEQAEQRLMQSYAGHPDDPEVLGGLGVIRMRQGHHAEAQAYFLQAQQRDPKNSRWQSLLHTARYWGLMRAASDASDAGQYALAEKQLHEAYTLDPREPASQAALGNVYVAEGRDAEAEQLFLQVLRVDASNGTATRGLARLYILSGRDQSAAALLAKQSPSQRRELQEAMRAIYAAMDKQKAEKLLADGHTDEAVVLLEQAARYDADDPWLRFDLARLYAARGDTAKGNELFDTLLQRHSSDDAAARYAYALFLSSHDDDVKALTTLQQIVESQRTENMSSLQRRLWIKTVTQRAVALAKQGDAKAARHLLDSAQEAVGDDMELTLDLVDARIDTGETEAANEKIVQLSSMKSPSVDWSLRYLRLAVHAGADDVVTPVLTPLESAKLTPEQAAALDDIKISIALRDIDNLRIEKQYAPALSQLAELRRTRPDNDRLLYAEARILRADGQYQPALDDYQHVLKIKPDDRDAATSSIEVLVLLHRNDEARQQITAQMADLKGASEDQVADLIGSLMDLQDYTTAQQLTNTALDMQPDSPRALAYASQLARRDGKLDDAISLLQHSLASDLIRQRQSSNPPALSTLRLAPASSPDTPIALQLSTQLATPPVDASTTAAQAMPVPVISDAPAGSIAADDSNKYNYRRLADMIDQNTTWFSTAYDQRTRSGTQGLSEYDATEIPMEWKSAQTHDGRWTYHADLVYLNAGSLNLADASNAATFGSVLLCQPFCESGSRSQSASGVALDAALQRDNVRYDIGTSPLGFPVQTLVGGILYKGDLGPFGYSIDASRRPLTGSILSYAGTTDPRTGQTWGGVDATGVRFGLSLDDGGRFGGWSSFGLHSLTGKNVMTNTRMQLMMGGNWRIINEDDRLFQVGLTAMDWKFSNNVGNYTFGDGGYYSPQSYQSLSLPVTFGERLARLSYSVRGAVSTSHSQTDAAPFFPTDPALQAQAEKLESVTNINPNYSAGPSHGIGRSLSMNWEYQVQSRLFFGGELELERSPDYSPNRFTVYLRYAIDKDASAKPVNFLPEPLIPISQY